MLTSLLFGIAHYPDQGLAGVQQSTIVGLLLGALLVRADSIVLPMVAHAAFDLTALWMIYWDLETEVAHLIFR